MITPFEKNLNVWRQLWRVIERSQVIIQIVDARNPLLFISKDLTKYITDLDLQKQTILLLNKSDYLSIQQRLSWSHYFKTNGIAHIFFSAFNEQLKQNLISDICMKKLSIFQKKVLNVNTQAYKKNPEVPLINRKGLLKFLEEISGSKKIIVGMIGYPNVGKSSIINVLLNRKNVGVTSTPGKTKNFQTIKLNEKITLCDCPGLIFPTFISNKSDLVLNNVLAIDNLIDLMKPCKLLTRRIPIIIINHVLRLRLKPKLQTQKILDEFCFSRGYMLRTGMTNRTEAAKCILKKYVKGELIYCHPPPQLNFKERQMFWEYNTQLRVLQKDKSIKQDK